MQSLYQTFLLQHYKNPCNALLINNYTHESSMINHACGDQALVRCLIESGILKDVCIVATGCVISVAAASLFSEYIKKKTLSEIITLDSSLMLDLIKIPVGPVRLKCALLSFDAVMKGLKPGS